MSKITIDTEKCVCCGDCAGVCPVRVYERTTPPCQAACPISTEAEGYVSLIAQGKFEEALAVNRRVNPLTLSIGRVCNHPCETKCTRGKVDEPIAICALKRFIGDDELLNGRHRAPAPALRSRPEKVAIVGSGPAGLGAADRLLKLGYGVTVFEAENIPGGMLHWGIPQFRLPKAIVQQEVDDIRALGADIRTGVMIGRDLALDDLRGQGYQAILLAVGAQQCRFLGIPGEPGPGVTHCLNLMRRVVLGEKVAIGANVVVVGGGNVAVDSARTVRRLGAGRVTMVCLEAREKMPASAHEVKAAEEEGIEVLPGRECLEVLRGGGAVSGIRCIKLASMRFEAGNLITDRIAGTEHVVPADMIISAIGQVPDVGGISGLKQQDVTRSGRMAADRVTGALSESWLFAAGDAVTGPATVVEAVASGKRAADGIDAYLGGAAAPPAVPQEQPAEPMIDEHWGEIHRSPRRKMREMAHEQRVSSFEEVELGFEALAAMEDARRCLGCGVFGVIDVSSCCGPDCGLCMDNCWQQALVVSRGRGAD